jgi:anti-sigma factor RsiW
MSDELSPEDEMIAKVSDYLDGLLSGADKDTVAQKIESDPAWKETHAEMVETRKALSGLQKARAPGHFAQDVTETIHKRSQGRFFGRRTLGDRVPLVPLVVVAMLALVVIAYVMWSSQTGSLKVHHEHDQGSASELHPGL